MAYEVWRHSSNNPDSAINISSVESASTTYNDTTAVAGITYHYRVKAKNSIETSGYSSSDNGYWQVTPPTSYTVTPSAGANGSISPDAIQTVKSGGSVSFTALPNADYLVDQWLANGSQVQTGGNSYKLSNVMANKTVQVTFKIAQTATRVIALGGNTSFGNVVVGSSAGTTLRITNTGNSTLNVSGISYTAGFNGNWTGGTIAAGGFRDVSVTFSPTTVTSYSGTITVNSDKTSGELTIPVSGAGIFAPKPEIVVEQPHGNDLPSGIARDYGAVSLGATQSLSFTIKNAGNANLTGLSVTKSGPHAADFLVVAPGMSSLAPSEETSFTATFAPTAPGQRRATIQIASNDDDENPFDVLLSGESIYDLFRIALTDPFFEPAVGHQLTLDLNRLSNPGETIKLVGKLPTGLKFNATTGLLSGVLSGKAGTYPLTVQFLQGKTVVRTVSLPLTILPYPAALLGSFEGLLDDAGGKPTGVIRLSITKPNAWSASLVSAGGGRRSAKGSFLLDQQTDTVSLTANFAASKTVPAESVSMTLAADSPLFAGTHARGGLRGFRMAQGAEIRYSAAVCNIALDAGTQDGIAAPAGIGWLSGKFGKTGSGSLKGMLGDATTASLSLRISATGQALVWAQPYANKQSFLGGIIDLPATWNSSSDDEQLEPGLWWIKAVDTKTLSYPSGFGPLPVAAISAAWTPPASALALGSNLGWADGRTTNLLIEGAGLSNAEPQITALAIPTALTLDDLYNLNATAPQGVLLIPWLGKMAKTDGKWTGTLTLPVGFAPEVLADKASASGVLLPGAEMGGCGLIKVPVAGPKGSFRTAAAILGD
jgi:hypothetical protein